MKQLTLTDREYALLSRAVEVQNDIINDTALENITAVNLWSQEPVAVLPEQLTELRKELSTAMEEVAAMRSLMAKMGLSVNEMGYSA